jgi:hypothetical protein
MLPTILPPTLVDAAVLVRELAVPLTLAGLEAALVDAAVLEGELAAPLTLAGLEVALVDAAVLEGELAVPLPLARDLIERALVDATVFIRPRGGLLAKGCLSCHACHGDVAGGGQQGRVHPDPGPGRWARAPHQRSSLVDREVWRATQEGDACARVRVRAGPK